MDHALIPAIFIRKLNRFLCEVVINEVLELCHIPNTGRLSELLFEGNSIWVRACSGPKRKTKFELALAEKNGKMYSVDSKMPNKLFKEWHAQGLLKGFANTQLIPEKTFGDSRFDFRITGQLTGFIEAKGVTLEREGIGYFPDAPTERGRKHLKGLIDVKHTGQYAAVVFICQSSTIEAFKPNDVTDPEFGQLLRCLEAEDIDLLAYACHVTVDGIEFLKEIPVIL